MLGSIARRSVVLPRLYADSFCGPTNGESRSRACELGERPHAVLKRFGRCDLYCTI